MSNMATKMWDQSKIAAFYKNNESLIKWLWYTAAIGYGGVESIKYVSGN
jgi:hypothetical protein